MGQTLNNTLFTESKMIMRVSSLASNFQQCNFNNLCNVTIKFSYVTFLNRLHYYRQRCKLKLLEPPARFMNEKPKHISIANVVQVNWISKPMTEKFSTIYELCARITLFKNQLKQQSRCSGRFCAVTMILPQQPNCPWSSGFGCFWTLLSQVKIDAKNHDINTF